MIYQIKIKGKLDKSWSDWLGSARITLTLGKGGDWITTLVADVPDPPALFGILDRIRDLNLTLISVQEMGREES